MGRGSLEEATGSGWQAVYTPLQPRAVPGYGQYQPLAQNRGVFRPRPPGAPRGSRSPSQRGLIMATRRDGEMEWEHEGELEGEFEGEGEGEFEGEGELEGEFEGEGES